MLRALEDTWPPALSQLHEFIFRGNQCSFVLAKKTFLQLFPPLTQWRGFVLVLPRPHLLPATHSPHTSHTRSRSRHAQDASGDGPWTCQGGSRVPDSTEGDWRHGVPRSERGPSGPTANRFLSLNKGDRRLASRLP